MTKRAFPFLAISTMLSITAGFCSSDIPFTRAVYRPSSTYWRYNFTRLGEAGIDCYYGYGGNWLWTRDMYEDRYGKQSLEAAANNITYIAGPYYMAVNWERINFNYTRAVGPDGVVERHTPSPIDETWWYLQVEEPALIIANLSLYYPIWGIVWDMELYGHDTFKPSYYTYDNPALRAFGNATNTTIPSLPSVRRYFWLEENGLLGQYHNWLEQRAYDIAKSTADKVHAINPNLSLGILYFEDNWYYWQILRAFMTPQAPVTGWNEQSYPGFRLGGDEGIDTYQQLWIDHGLNGKFLPGLAALKPWELLTHTEACLRQNEALWIYLGNPYPAEFDAGYERIFKAIEHYFYFNQSELNPAPLFYLNPGVEARAYIGPGNRTSVFLTPYRQKEKGARPLDVVTSFTLPTDEEGLVYMGENLSKQILSSPNPILTPDDIPCIVYGLEPTDLLRTEDLAIIRELEDLREYSSLLGLGKSGNVWIGLHKGREAFEAGSYAEAQQVLMETRERVYSSIIEEIWPLVEQGLTNPRNTTIPLSILRSLSKARNYFLEGKVVPGETYLYSGLKEWSSSIDEPNLAVIISLLGIPALRLRFRDVH